MPSTPKNESAEGDRLPFEPSQGKKKKPEKKKAEAKKPTPTPPKTRNSSSSTSRKRSSSGIPEVISRRMVKRMAFFCGVPTLLGFSSFFVSYFIVVSGAFELPNTAVLLVSLGFFGLGVFGLSYGALSTSWDEDAPGGLIGFREFQTNLGRMQQAWRDARNQSKQSE